MSEFGCVLLSPAQELDAARRGEGPPEDSAGQVGHFLLKRFSSPFLTSTLSGLASCGVICLCHLWKSRQ